MADRNGIEVARVGDFKLSTGDLTITPSMLHHAAERSMGDSFRASVHLGHTDPRFRGDGEPALGWLHNLRVSGEGDAAVLLGDVHSMPDWLAEIEPVAYPDRSLEGFVVENPDGEDTLEITGLALLGVTPPGIDTIRSLRDVKRTFGFDGPIPIPFAASFRAAGDVQAAAVSTKPWGDYSQADYTPEQWKAACLIVTGDGSTKDQCSLPVKEPDGTLNANGVHAAAARIDQVNAPADAKQAAAKTLVGYYRNDLKATPPPDLLTLAGIKASGATDPGGAAGAPTTPKEADTMSDTITKGLRERLGIADDAELDDEAILAEFDKQTTAAAELLTKPTEPKTGEPVVPEGSTVIDSDVLDELRVAAKAGMEARKVQLRQERDTTIGAAIAGGHIAPARREHWAKKWDADPDGVKASIDELCASDPIFPVAASGYTSNVDEIDDEDALYKKLFGDEPAGEKVSA